ncbi:Putative metal-binding motif-containing protein [Nannocystis exedens]|uniref:Putative metal-binding motif-containing protein n=1 Tax=Nannocystis exedens TaxID=54 RepID=A0A1I2BT86_9BACT|nr:CotH kinase family protein [Nannocystis exedens]PCC71268.1 lectin [Nannocystis exedens]SFE59289.1 Putative metal-binding motif-containing protein [Nannocystis exedens]
MARNFAYRTAPLLVAVACTGPSAQTTDTDPTTGTSGGETTTTAGPTTAPTTGTATDPTTHDATTVVTTDATTSEPPTGTTSTASTGDTETTSGTASTGDTETTTETGGEPDPYAEAEPLFAFGARAEFDITLSDEAIAALNADGKEYTKGDLVAVIDGQTYELPEIGVRLKGNYGSYRTLDQKAAFLLNFDRYVDDQRLLGLEKLAVNNMVQDCSMQQEILGYMLFRDVGVAAPRAGHVVVRVNGEPYGLYTAVESVDNEPYLDHWYGSDKGSIYEGAYGSDIENQLVPSFDQDNGDDIASADLYAFAAALDAIADPATFTADVAAVLDLPRYLDFAATELYLGHWDGYAWTKNNYYIHRLQEDGALWTFMPWGIDQILRDHLDPFGGQGRLAQMCAASLPCRELLADSVDHVLARVDALDLAGAAAELGASIAPAVAADPRKECSDGQNTDAIAANVDFFLQRKASVEAGLACTVPSDVDLDGDGYSACTDDCNDDDPDVHPDAQEACDLDDDNCDGIWDEDPLCPHCVEKDLPGPGTAQLCFVALPFAEAEADCVAQGGHLLSIPSQEIQDWAVAEAFAVAGSDWWIGLNDVDAEDDFVWTDGAPLAFTAWNEGEPNNVGEEDCVNLPTWSGGLWNDLGCGTPLPYICRTP